MKYKNRMNTYSDMIAKFYPFKYSKDEYNKIQTPVITFQVTDKCNLCCTYCYQINKNTHVLPLQTAKDFIDMLLLNDNNTQQYIDTKKCDAVIIEFIGGEPFLEIELIDQITDYFVKRIIETNHPWQYNWRISISSNGVLYFNPQVQAYIKKWFNKLSLNISIDGNKELHDACRIFSDGTGSYDLAIQAAKHYKNILHGDLGSKMTIAPQNVNYVFKAVKNFIDLGYEDINLNCVFEKGWTKQHGTILYNELKKLADFLLSYDLEDIYISIFDERAFKPKSINDKQNWCGGNGSMLALDWKGDIYPCIRYMESSLGNQVPPIIIGNTKEGIMTNELCKNCINTLKQVNRLSQSTQECINCSIAEGCSWCQAYNYQDSGDFNHRATYICIMHQARALANCYYWNNFYKKYNDSNRMHLYLEEERALEIISKNEYAMLQSLEKL